MNGFHVFAFAFVIHFEDMAPPEDVEQCEDGECVDCFAARAQDEADDYAAMHREDARIDSRWGE